MAQALCDRFGGEVPNRLEDLVTLPAVGRKTANVVSATPSASRASPSTPTSGAVPPVRLHHEDDPVKVEHRVGALLAKKE